MSARTLRLGTRASDLALTQARGVAARLARLGATARLVPIETRGDTDVESPFGAIGAFGIFARELQRALLEGRIDLAVHSHKDLPTQGPAGLVVAAVPEREDARDVLVVREEAYEPDLGTLAVRRGARVGTASARRAALLAHLRPDLVPVHLRGNVPTRLAKLAAGEADALLLAAAGLARLTSEAEAGGVAPLPLAGLVLVPLDPEVFVPAPSQGALALEARADDDRTLALLAELDDPRLGRVLAAERGLLASLEGGCNLALGAWCRALPPTPGGAPESGNGAGELELVCALERGGRLLRARVRGSDPGELARRAEAELTGSAPRRGLEGLRVLLTRSAQDNERWGARLEELGARVRGLVCVATAELPERRAELVGALADAEWLALASRRAVDAVARLAGPLPAGLLVAAVGPGTERAALEVLGRCDLVAPEGTGASLGAALARRARGTVVVAAAQGGRREVEEALAEAGIPALRVEVYGPAPLPAAAPEDPGGLELDAVVLASPSALRGLQARAPLPRGVVWIAIGPTTAAAAREAGLAPLRTAAGRGIEALVAALAGSRGASEASS